MHLDKRLQAVASFVPQGAAFADIGTDHAYLPVWLLEKGIIASAVAGDIAAGPCQAARTTVAMHGAVAAISVRQGSGLAVLKPGEVDCIAICGMGGSTISSILAADMSIALSVRRLILQPMAGAAALRRWLVNKGWHIIHEELVEDEPHFYEIICAEREAGCAMPNSGAGDAACGPIDPACYSKAEYLVGPALLREGHALLAKQFARQEASLQELLANMARSERAKVSAKYQETVQLAQALAELKAKYKDKLVEV